MFLSIVTAGRVRGPWQEYVQASCIQRRLTFHGHIGPIAESIVLFNPSVVSQLPPRLFCALSEQPIFLSLMDSLFFGAAIATVIDLYIA